MTTSVALDLESDWLAEKANAIRALGKRSVEAVVEIERILIEVHERLEHGQWESWLTTEFGWSAQTARNCMRLADPKNKKFLDLDIPLSSLYLLTAPKSMLESVREEVIARAEAGEQLKHSEIVELVREAKESAEDESDDESAEDDESEPEPPTDDIRARFTVKNGEPTTGGSLGDALPVEEKAPPPKKKPTPKPRKKKLPPRVEAPEPELVIDPATKEQEKAAIIAAMRLLNEAGSRRIWSLFANEPYPEVFEAVVNSLHTVVLSLRGHFTDGSEP
jgi:hypothetical protein